MNKRWLLSITLLALVLPTLHVYAMEEELEDEFAAQRAAAPFFERVQVYGLPSPDGLLVVRCHYSTGLIQNHFVDKNEMRRYDSRGYYPWDCHIKICMNENPKNVVGSINAAGTFLHKIEWLEGNQLRILATTLVPHLPLQWFDCVYTLDGTWLNNGMGQRLQELMDRASSFILPSS